MKRLFSEWVEVVRLTLIRRALPIFFEMENEARPDNLPNTPMINKKIQVSLDLYQQAPAFKIFHSAAAL